MPVIKKNISISNEQNAWIQAQIGSGHYDNENEVISELIHEHQTRMHDTPTEINTIRAKLMEGEKSGFTQQSAQEILAEIKEELNQNGSL